MRQPTKRLSLLLVLCLLLGALGVPAWAEEPESGPPAEPPGALETLESLAVPENPETPETPEAPEGPESPGDPETPEGPESPENPEDPESPENPEGPESPENPEGPESPESPGDPENPAPSSAPEKEAPMAGTDPAGSAESYAVHPGVGAVEDSIPFSQLPASIGLEPGLSYTGSYYDQLDSASKTVYDAICQSPVMDGPTTEQVRFTAGAVPYTSSSNIAEPVMAALAALLYDHPELSWLVNTSFGYSYSSSGRYITYYRMSDEGYRNATTDPGPAITSSTRLLADTGDRADIEAALAAAKGELGSLDGLPAYARVKTLYDWVCRHMDYTDQNGSKFRYGWRGFQTVYSALVERETVCAGYSKAFKLLCDEYGIPCAIVTGLGNGGPHAWNYVQMDDGAWYAVDCTWGDQRGYISYDYFLKGSGGFGDHEEGTLFDEYAFAYPPLSRGDYSDPTAPASIDLSCDTPADGLSGTGLPSFFLPTVETPGAQTVKEIRFTAVPKSAAGEALTDKPAEWSLDRTLEGVTLTADGNTAVLAVANSALGAYNNGSGPIVTVTASCGTTSAQTRLLIYVPTRTPSFLQILRDGTVLSANDTIPPDGSATYTARVYDQYGTEVTGQTAAWEAAGPVRTVPNGASLTLTPTASSGTASVTASLGALRASLSIQITAGAHRHAWAEAWTRDGDFHWHECAASGCGISANSAKDGYAPHSYDGAYRNNSSGHWRVCVCGAESAPENHAWDGGTVTEAPSFEAPGLRTYHCAACGWDRTEEIPRLEHSYSSGWTCDESTHWHACTDAGYAHLESGREAHLWDSGTVTKDPSFEAPGLRAYFCTVCGYARTQEVPPLEHSYSDLWSRDSQQHWHICTDDGYGQLEKDRGPHLREDGGACSVCGYAPAAVTGITVTGSPYKLSYAYGEELDTAGLTVSASYSDGSARAVTSFRVSGYSAVTPGSQTVTVSYTEDGVTVTAGFAVTVSEKPAAGMTARPQIAIRNVPGGKEATLTCATPGAVIHYTTDGVIPDSGSAVYSGPIPLTAPSTTLKAIAISGGTSSAAAAGIISVPQASPPAACPAEGQVDEGTLLTLRSATAGASIYCTTDGSEPSPENRDQLYQGFLILEGADVVTVKAIAVKDGCAASPLQTYTYRLNRTAQPEVTVTLGSAAADAGKAVSVPLYLFAGEADRVTGFDLTVDFPARYFESAVSITPAKGITASRLLASDGSGGSIRLVYSGGAALTGGGAVCTLNLTSLVSAANTPAVPVTLNEAASTVTVNGSPARPQAINGTVSLGEAFLPAASAGVLYTDQNGHTITSASDAGKTGSLGVSLSVSGASASSAVVCLVIYDRGGRMAGMDTWKVDLSDPAFLFAQTIAIPAGVEVGSIKLLLLSETMAPLGAASELAGK